MIRNKYFHDHNLMVQRKIFFLETGKFLWNGNDDVMYLNDFSRTH